MKNFLSEIDNINYDRVKIKERLSGSKFYFKYPNFFYKSNTSNHITIVDRCISSYWDNAIDHLSTLNKELDQNLIFCFEYFPIHKPGEIYYEYLPKNNLVLSHIKDISKGEKNSTIIYDDSVLKEYSKIFNVDYLYFIFNDKIKYKDKFNSIIKYKKLKDLLYFLSFSNSYKNPLMNPIYSLVFYIDDNNYKLDFFNRTLKQNDVDKNDLFIFKFIEYLNNKDLNSIFLQGNSPEEKYISLVCELFNSYINSNQSIPFLNDNEILSSYHKLNKNYIKDEYSLENLKDKNSEKFFQFILGLLNPFKKFNRKIFKKYDSELDKIKVNIYNIIKTKDNNFFMNKNEMFSFKEFNNLIEDDKEISSNEEKQALYNSNNSINIVKVDDKKNNPSNYINVSKKRGSQDALVFISKFQPFTTNHIEEARSFHQILDGQNIIFVTLKNKNPNKSNPFSDELRQKMFNSLKENYSFIEDLFFVESYHPDDIFKSVRPYYEPSGFIITGENYNIMKLSIYKNRDDLNTNENLKFIKFDEPEGVLKNLSKENDIPFKERLPECLNVYYDEMKISI